MSILQTPQNVNSQNDLAKFVEELLIDYRKNKDSWENADLDSFLEAMSAWVQDLDGYYENNELEISTLNKWRILADILMASRVYQ